MEPALDCDVAIVGCGDVGSAIARELSRFELRLMVIEAGADVGVGTSKANTAILHTGFDAPPETTEARLVARGHQLLSAYAREVGIPREPTGALMIAWTQEQLERLPAIRRDAGRNGYGRIREVTADELYRREPHLGPGALGGLEIPDEGIICPWTPPLACATQAVLAGARLLRGTRVTGLERLGGGWRLTAGADSVTAGWMINAAGLFSDEIHAMAGHGGFKVTPRRGELIVFDKLARPLVSQILLPVPSATSKGMLIAPTVFGNVMLGPTAVDTEQKTAAITTAAGIASLQAHGRRVMPELLEHEVTATYAGLRAATEHRDYQLLVDAEGRYACAAGIRSTGLTSSLAIAEYLRGEPELAGLPLRERPGGLPASVCRTRADRRRPRVRTSRLFLRAGHQRRDQGCGEQPDPAARHRRPSPSHPRDHGSLPGVLLRGRGDRGARRALPTLDRRDPVSASVRAADEIPLESADVVVIGGGPSGLAAATGLREAGVGRVVVLEREREAGGIPRHANHQGFGVRDLHRVMSGPKYAARLADEATRAGAELWTETDATGWEQDGSLVLTSPRGRTRLEAGAVVLASGCRERPRSARLVPGSRPQGVVTTGTLQQLVYLQGAHPGRRAVVVGGELVSFSALLTLAHGGARTVAQVTEAARHQTFGAVKVAAALRFRVPLLTRTAVTDIRGRERVEAVELTDLRTGKASELACDLVVFTADWIPEAELAALAGATLDPGTRGPQVDLCSRTSRAGLFAVGNAIQGAEAADVAALSGRRVVGPVLEYLEDGVWPTGRVPLVCEEPLRWISPNSLAAPATGGATGRSHFALRGDEALLYPRIELVQGGTTLSSGRLAGVWPGRSARLPLTWANGADPEGGPVLVRAASALRRG